MKVQGTITDSKATLPGAHIYVKENGKFVFKTTTDASGFFTLPGSYTATTLPTIKVSYIGYQDHIQTAGMGNLIVLKESTAEVGAVTVTGKKSEVLASAKTNYYLIALVIAIGVGFIYRKKLKKLLF